MKYSNCLIEAIIAKIKSPKNVKIIYLPKKLNKTSSTIPHFFWENIKDGKIFHYINPNGSKQFMYKGEIKNISKKAFDRFVYKRILEKTQKDRNKLTDVYKINFLDSLCWYFVECNELPNVENAKALTNKCFIQILCKECDDYKVIFKKVDDNFVMPANAVAWKYLTEFDDLSWLVGLN